MRPSDDRAIAIPLRLTDVTTVVALADVAPLPMYTLSLAACTSERCDQTENRVKHFLTDDQVCRLLCIGRQRNLVGVESIQSMEKAHHERHPYHRTFGAGHSCSRCNCCFCHRYPVRAAGRVDRNADAFTHGAV